MKRIKNNPIAIVIILILISLLCIGLYVGFIKSKENEQEVLNASKDTYQKTGDVSYKLFSPQKDGKWIEGYDYTQDMEYSEGIYNKKIQTYSEYLIYKDRWNDICDMSEKDFYNSFMIITAVENTSMLGLTVDNVETDSDTLYISLIKIDDEDRIDENLVCISYIIPKSMEREKIVAIRNVNDNERNYDSQMQIAVSDDVFGIGDKNEYFMYKTEEIRGLEEQGFALKGDWKDAIGSSFTITKSDKDVDVFGWDKVLNEDNLYYKRITKCSDYMKLVSAWSGMRDLGYNDFKNCFVIIVVNTSTDYFLKFDKDSFGRYMLYEKMEKEKQAKIMNLELTIGGMLDITEDYKYSAVQILIPNYMLKNSSEANIVVKKNEINISCEEAISIMKAEIEKADILKDYAFMDRAVLVNAYPNNFMETKSYSHMYEEKEDKARLYTCWRVNAISANDPFDFLTIYINAENGEVMGGRRRTS